jgi:hypothetical protein
MYGKRIPITAAVLTVAVLGALAGPALANPLPEYNLYTHIQTESPYFDCTEHPGILSCEDFVQYTYHDGYLEFDLFIVCDFDWPVYAFETVLTWEPAWSLVDWEFCHNADVDLDFYANSLELTVTWPDCATPENGLLHAARFIVDVAGEGTFGPDGWANFWFGCPPEPDPVPGPVHRALAGYECSYCYDRCPGGERICYADMTPDELILEVVQGGSAQEYLDAHIYGGDSYDPCPMTFSVTENWMTLEEEWTDYNDVIVTLTVDTAELGPGSYEGWLRATEDCRDCTKVILEVIGTQGIPDEDDLPDRPDDAARQVSWGELKDLYK